jgi:predicted Zn-dependent peptidase
MMKKTFFASLLAALLVFAAAFAALGQAPQNPQPPAQKAAQAPAQPAQVPQGPRPEQFKFQPLNFKPPKPADYRKTLSNGLVVYIAEDHDIPWFNASLMLRTGPFLEPKDKLGVDSFTRSIIRTGGTASMTGEQINERMDFLAGSVSSTSLSIHTRHLDEGLKIWMDLLENPAFPEDKLRREKDLVLPSIRNRNKAVSTVTSRTYRRLIYGEDSPIAAEMTEAGVTSITRDDLMAWHRQYWGANNAILVVTGDFQLAAMMQKLEATFGKWRTAEKAVPPIPKVQQATKAGVYMVQPEVIPNQGVIQIGHVGIMQDDPDYPAVDLMNYILGGGSFSSRITKVVRTDHGLAYSASSSYPGGVRYPGTFTAFCQTKNSTVVFAAQLMLDLIEGMRVGEVTEADLAMAKKARLNAFPAMFPDIGAIVSRIASLEYDNRPTDYYDVYEAKYAKVTVADIKRVAQKWLQRDKLVILVGGNIEECKAGADKMLPDQQSIEAMAAKFGGRTIDSLAKKYGDGEVHVVPLK